MKMEMPPNTQQRTISTKSSKSSKSSGHLDNSGTNSTARFPRTQEAEEETIDAVITPPVVNDLMFYGLLGRFAGIAADGTEVNPVAAMAACMTWLSANMGRNPGFEIGDGWHQLRLFTLHVGRSSKGGKGMALDLLKRVDRAIRELPTGSMNAAKWHTGGLSSREGLALLIHDGYTEGRETVPPIEDKRLFIVESEFANVLAQAKRDGNTLSACLRDAWDGGSIRPATKTSRLWASHPHIALHGCITPHELRIKMSKGELTNGFANRFLMVWAERTCLIPFPRRAPNEEIRRLTTEFNQVINFALSGYPKNAESLHLTLSDEAKLAFSDAYLNFSKRHPGGDMIAGLLERRAPMLRRIAGLFAITDLKTEIDTAHILAARAWIEYCSESAHLIFSPSADTAGEVQRNNIAEKLIGWLTDSGGWKSRTEITRDCFMGRVRKFQIDSALERLALDGKIERREIDNGGITKRTDYRASIKSS